MRRYPAGSFIEFGNRNGDQAVAMVARVWNPLTPIVETGTHYGYMTSRLHASLRPSSLVTIEADVGCWRAARAKLPTTIHCALGSSVLREEAFGFMQYDDWLTAPEQYPHIYADGSDAELAQVYWKEVCGELFTPGQVHPPEYEGEDLLRKYVRRVREDSPLIVLDSAGGIGYLEFRTVREIMGYCPVAYLLDDVRHVKHARSLAQLLADDRFDVFVSAGAHAWALATCRDY